MWTEKGNSSILEKRVLGRWDEFKAKNKHWTARRGGDPAEDNAHMFAAQPDFANQKTALHEAVISEISLTSQVNDTDVLALLRSYRSKSVHGSQHRKKLSPARVL
ncbi:hypothetical protein DFQ29_004207 [Apophysomyces sp. BC1021]|nr:hypothetical protein DFQ29_004207 [Apophysomyces sp. BC1021]